MKYNLRYWDDHGNSVSQEVDLIVPPENVTIISAKLTKVKSIYRQWCDKLGSKLPEMSLQSLMQTVYDHGGQKYSKIEVIKAVRVIDRDLGLKEAKDIVDSVFCGQYGYPQKGNFD